MKKHTFAFALFSVIAGASLLAAEPAQAGSHVVQPGATAQIDVADRGGYTTIIIINTAAAAGSLQIPTGASTLTVPANGRTELYDRYSNGPIGNATVTVTNTGSVPLRVISQYSVRIPLP